jgi:hypothetical protein
MSTLENQGAGGTSSETAGDNESSQDVESKPRGSEVSRDMNNSTVENMTATFLRESMANSEDSSSESFFKRSEFLDPLVRISTLKYMTSPDLKVAASVNFALLDLRYHKKPRLPDVMKLVSKKTQKKINLPIIEIPSA